jgi:hypothetical protein
MIRFFLQQRFGGLNIRAVVHVELAFLSGGSSLSERLRYLKHRSRLQKWDG